MTKLIRVLAVGLFLFTGAFPASAAMAAPSPKVMLVLLENTNYEQALSQPFLGMLARQGALLTQYFALTHPSQPNYIALVAGDTLGVGGPFGDRNVDLNASHLGDLIENAGKSWRVYAEDYPGNCFLGATSGRFARKHVPFLSFLNVQRNPARCARITDSSTLAADIAQDRLADFSFVTPDMDDDGHDTDVNYADRWMDRTFGSLIRDGHLPPDLLLIVTFDEGTKLSRNQVYTALYGAGVRGGAVSSQRYDHLSLLRTIELALGLPGTLGRGDARATPISDVWR